MDFVNCKKIVGSVVAITLIGYGTTLPVKAQPPSDEAELQRLEQELERLERELEPILQQIEDMEALGRQIDEYPLNGSQLDEIETATVSPETLARLADFEMNLTDCSPGTYPDLILSGMTEIIRGWAEGTCQVDRLTNIGDMQAVHQCFYTLQDIELITGPELYLPDDLERQCQRIK